MGTLIQTRFIEDNEQHGKPGGIITHENGTYHYETITERNSKNVQYFQKKTLNDGCFETSYFKTIFTALWGQLNRCYCY